MLEDRVGFRIWPQLWKIIYDLLGLACRQLSTGIRNPKGLLVNCFTSRVHYRRRQMAPYSSTLAWKIPWMKEPGRLQPMGSLRVRHDWVTWLSLFTFMHWRRKWQPTPVFLPGESQWWQSLVGCRLWGCTVGHNWSDLAAAAVAQTVKNLPAMQETQVQSLGREDLLEKGMATHSSIPA